MIGRLLLILLSLLVFPRFAMGEDRHEAAFPRRVALVIGNGAYAESSSVLKNPGNDATAIAAELRDLGIEVIEAVDLDYRGMRDTLRKFDRALQGADAALFYYAGHAMEYQGQNYLFPTDAILETEGDVGLGLIDMDQVLKVMETTVPTRLVFLDACRNNPLAHSFRRSLGASREASVGRGLARMQTVVGTFIAYATAPGDVAADGKGINSPFTAAMLAHLDEPGLEISQLMQRVRNSVIETTNEEQIPWDSSSLRSPFILNLNITIQSTSDGADHTETVFWDSIKGKRSIADFEAYIERFGHDGLFTPLARSQIAALRQEQLAASESAVGFNRRDVQEALLVLGYDPGALDGVLGPRTRAAIKAWQEENADQVTGYVSKRQAALIQNQAEKTQQPTILRFNSRKIPFAEVDDADIFCSQAFRQAEERLEACTKTLEAAHLTLEERAVTLRRRARAQSELGHYQEAIDDLSLILDVTGFAEQLGVTDRSLSEWYVDRGQAHESLGNLQQAKVDYQRALEYDPESSSAEKALRRLAG